MRLITLNELAEKLNVSTAQVYRLIKRGGKNPIPFIEIGGVYRFDPVEIERWLLDGGTNGKDE